MTKRLPEDLWSSPTMMARSPPTRSISAHLSVYGREFVVLKWRGPTHTPEPDHDHLRDYYKF